MKTFKIRSLIYIIVLVIITVNKVSGQSAQIWKERDRLPTIKDSIELINTMNYVGILYQSKNIDSCFYFAEKAKALSIKLRYTKGKLDADNVIGVALNSKGLHKESLEIYSKTITGYQEMGDDVNVVQSLMNMALVYANIPDSIQTKKYFHQALSLGNTLKQDSILSILYFNYSTILSPSTSEDSIKYYEDKSNEIAKKHRSDWVPVLIMQSKAYRLLLKNDKNALPLIEESLRQSRLLNMEFLEIYSFALLGHYYLYKNDGETALKYYQKAYKLAVATGNTYTYLPASYSILDAAKLTGDLVTINQSYELLQDVINQENHNLKKFIGDYVNYNSINENNKLLEISNNSNRAKIWMLIIILIISGLLFVFIYLQYRVSRQLNKKISEQNISLQNSLSALEESQEENTRMMKIVAHDLRNPVGAIKMAASLLDIENIDIDKDKKVLEIIIQSADNSLELVSNLLNTQSKLEEIDKEPLNMQNILNYCADLLKHKAIVKEQYIKIITQPITLNGSREKLWRVVSNLIANAIKFSPHGATIYINMEKVGNDVLISVKDNGIGIPEEMKDKVFDMFTKAGRVGTSGEQSFGLGLAISKQIVEAHGGTIWFESMPGNGTTFWVKLPHNS